MGRVSLLDCTLRDGGYVNDWKFGQGNLVSIFERLVDSGADFIEVGFLDDRRPFDIDRSIMPDTDSVGKIFGALDKKGSEILAMIDYGTCSIENLKPCSDSCLDGIRVIFKKHLMGPALEYCRQVKALGYRVFAQLVSVTAYSDEELEELARLANDVKPFAVSMVDTYGLTHSEDVLHIYKILDEKLDPEIAVGFHGHNSFQMAYANSVSFIEYTSGSERDIFVDGSLFGMGKSAGNAPAELLAMWMNMKLGKEYDIDSMLEAISESLMDFYGKSPWGYQMFFFLCGKNRCHPNYLQFFNGKKNLSITKADRIMANIEPEDKKLLYDKDVAEALYSEFIDGEFSDYKDRLAFVRETAGRKLLIIGPGKNILLQKDKVNRFIETENPYIISINYIPDIAAVDCVFLTNAKRYHDMTLALKDEKNRNVKFLATSNVERRNGSFDFVINRAPLLETDESIIDNSFLMLVKFLRSVEVREIFCAGFDGYSDRESNYCNPEMEYSFVKREAVHLNKHMKAAIADFRKDMAINFITYSAYDEEEDINGGSI